jgi:predicted O-linked N-acetylglucosamine transferase (SPINDLY family)
MRASERLYAKAERAYTEGRLAEAAELAEKLVRKAPRFAPGYSLKGTLEQRKRNYPGAIGLFQKAVSLQPEEAVLHNNLGHAYRESGEPEKAADCFRQALHLRPQYAIALNNLGLAQLDLNQVEASLKTFDEAIAARPEYAKAYHNRGTALRRRGALDEAMASFRRALKIAPFYTGALNGLGVTLRDKGEYAEALRCFERALELDPQYAKAALNRGITLADLTLYDEALANLRQALALRPNDLKTLLAQGVVLERQRQYDAAIASYREALQIAPSSADAHLNMGNALRSAGRFDEARAAFERAVDLDPALDAARANRLDARSEVCDWREREEDIAHLQAQTRHALESGGVPSLTASSCHRIVPSTSSEQLAIARDSIRRLEKRLAPLMETLVLPRRPAAGGTRIRLGYLSCDFRNNAVGHLAQQLFGLHDSGAFEVLAYSYGPDDKSTFRRRFEVAADRFIDVSAESDAQCARRIRDDGVDILIDLVGCAGNGRIEIAALRPAPVQVHFLGFPATTGAPFIDYFVTDPVVTPLDQDAHFQEQLAVLPHTYQINDTGQEIPETAQTREECGLPSSGFVFCCFNANYKITPEIFDVWMRILHRVPGSVLWLIETTRGTRENLVREARTRGVDPARLVFATRASKVDHLARHRLADLFLDTPLCNAHTTASDALWAGLPVLTCPGQVFAARVAASLLSAAELPELIAADMIEYEERAVSLATHAKEVTELRDRLRSGRRRVPLFDTPRFVQHLERAYLEMWRLYAAGAPPRQIVVEAVT